MPTTPKFRNPYVGEGVDGCRRSAQIDLEELDMLDPADPQSAVIVASVWYWEAQAQLIEAANAHRAVVARR